MYVCMHVAQIPKIVVNDEGIPTVSSSEKYHIVLSSFPLVVTMASIDRYVHLHYYLCIVK